MKALIIDDEAPARAVLRRLLLDHPVITLVGEADTMVAARARLKIHDYDVVFLDIQLLGGIGFDLMPFVRPGSHVIFVTAFDHYAVRAFEVNSLDYLLKPVRPQRLEETIRRLAGPPPMARALPSSPPALAATDLVYFKTGNGASRFVALADIAVIESQENYSEVHLGDGTRHLVRRTMKSWENVLPAAQFVRVHRTTIINLARYRGADRQSYEIMQLHLEGLPAPVRASFRYLPELRARLARLDRQL